MFPNQPLLAGIRELDEKSLLSKGPSFCPVPRDIDRRKLQEDWEKFENWLRAATFFYNDRDDNSSSHSVEEERKSVFPTVKKVSSCKAPLSKFPEVELFLKSIKKELFDPKNVSIAHDNLSVSERKAFFRLKNLDEQVIKIQDKGSKFVILDKTEYSSKMLGQLENPIHYNKLDADPSANFVSTFSEWSSEWLEKGQIDQNIANWVVNNKAKPGKAFGTIKSGLL